MQSLVLRRAHELHADAISAAIAGGDVTAGALISVSVKGSLLEQKMWPEFWKTARLHAEPPHNLFKTHGEKLKERVSAETTLPFLKADLQKHDPLDSHPSLQERVAALQPHRDLSDLEKLAEEYSQNSAVSISAAESLFDHKLDDLRQTLSEQWRKPLEQKWRQGYEAFQKEKIELKELEDKWGAEQLTDNEVVKFARLVSSQKETADAIVTLRKLVARFPNKGPLYQILGFLLLDAKSEECIETLEKTISLSRSNISSGSDDALPYRTGALPPPWCTCLAALLYFCKEQGRTAEAEAYEKRLSESLEEWNKASRASQALTLEDKFEPHSHSAAEVEKLCAIMNGEPKIKTAFLVKRVLPEIMGGSEHVLVVDLAYPLFGLREEETTRAREILLRLKNLPEFAPFYITTKNGIKTNLGKACKSFENASIYDRAKWKGTPLPETSSPQTTVFQPRSRFDIIVAIMKRNRLKLVSIAVIVFSLFVLIKGTVNENNANSDRRQANFPSPRETEKAPYVVAKPDPYGIYMQDLDARVKSNWNPPKGDHSMETVVMFKVSPKGRMSHLKIMRSSGDPEMDDAALHAVRLASPFAPLPPDAKQDVDVQFSLDYRVHQ
jgi:TonB family protein